MIDMVYEKISAIEDISENSLLGRPRTIHPDAETDPEYIGRKIWSILVKWKKKGLRLHAIVEGSGWADYNSEPFPDESTAMREYEVVEKALDEGRYKLVAGENNRLRLELKNEEGDL